MLIRPTCHLNVWIWFSKFRICRTSIRQASVFVANFITLLIESVVLWNLIVFVRIKTQGTGYVAMSSYMYFREDFAVSSLNIK